MVRININSYSKMETSQHIAKKSAIAAMVGLVALAAVPVWADTAQEKVIRRLTNDTSSSPSAIKEAIQPEAAQTSQSLEQKREEIRAQLHGNPSTSASATKDAVQPTEATSSQTSRSMEKNREEIRARLHGS